MKKFDTAAGSREAGALKKAYEVAKGRKGLQNQEGYLKSLKDYFQQQNPEVYEGLKAGKAITGNILSAEKQLYAGGDAVERGSREAWGDHGYQRQYGNVKKLGKSWDKSYSDFYQGYL